MFISEHNTRNSTKGYLDGRLMFIAALVAAFLFNVVIIGDK